MKVKGVPTQKVSQLTEMYQENRCETKRGREQTMDRNQINWRDRKQKRGEHCYGQLRGALKREGATTSHPPSDLWVAAMTDGEPLKLKVKSENPAILDCHCHRGKDK